MKILFGIQATGNGHIRRSETLIKALSEHAEVEVLMSGTQAEISPDVPVTYKLKGASFVFGKRGGVDLLQTWKELQISSIINDWNSVPILNYDLVVTDFEPISNWKARLNGIPSVGVANQYAALLKGYPKKSSIDILGKGILKNYAMPDEAFAYYYYPFHSRVCSPLIDEKLREATTKEEAFTLVYLPAHDPYDLAEVANHFPGKYFKIYGKKIREPFKGHNFELLAIDHEGFRESLLHCENVVTAAGFGLTTEALFLGKPMVVIPMTGQYEQQCNAVGLKKLGVEVVNGGGMTSFKNALTALKKAQKIKIAYSDQTHELAIRILESVRNKKGALDKGEESPYPMIY